MYEKILVPLDGSQSAEAVLAHVKQLAQCTGYEIILLHVVTYPHYDY
jgi:nucleotide-binding universal stress UspA family protein